MERNDTRELNDAIERNRAGELNFEACYRAARARDRRFDGRFFVGITSTRIYCRPICPARPARRDHMRFYSNAAAAECAGFRPCLRCRPETAPGIAPVDALSRLVGATIAGMEEHAVSSAHIGELAAALGVSERHLRRVTESQLGVSPIELKQTQRLLLAKRLLRETSLSLTEIAFASGFGSVRRFNASFKSRYNLNPRAVRGAGSSTGSGVGVAGIPADGLPVHLKVQLEFRPPLAWKNLLCYLRLRAIPGVEMVDATHYRRTVAMGDVAGWIGVSMHDSGAALNLEISPHLSMHVGAIIARVKRLFDLGSAPAAVSDLLRQDGILRDTVERIPGLRVAGAFDGFELAVRTVLGQQISIKGASTVAGRWAAALGAPVATPYLELNRLAPKAADMAGRQLGEIAALGMVGSRANCLIELAKAVADRRVNLSPASDAFEQMEKLEALPGIGPWTANYIAMRALHWPDAFPAGDLMLMRAAKLKRKPLEARAEAWRPWRAYAAHYLWQSLADPAKQL
jgi:AraC family transcriptional regulator of adaptative response / DNA-3-methyladenine glycosylase II